MSKVDAQRAMREARYASNRATGASRGEAAPVARTSPAPAARTPIAKPARPAAAPTATAGALCGHKSMNGRTCTREAAHSEKNHRYS